MNLSTSYHILKLNPGASMEEVKKAYRAMALSLHPDHNSNPHAHRQFQHVHEAYLMIKAHLDSKSQSAAANASQAYARQAAQSAEAKADPSFRSWAPKREEDDHPPFSWRKKTQPKPPQNERGSNGASAKRTGKSRGAPERPKTQETFFRRKSSTESKQSQAQNSSSSSPKAADANPLFSWIRPEQAATIKNNGQERANLGEAMGNPDTRRFFDGIYDQLKNNPPAPKADASAPPKSQNSVRAGGPSRPGQIIKLETEAAKNSPRPGEKIWNSMKSWLRSQMDEEQTLYVPRDVLLPGAKLRLQIRQPWSGEMMGIEVTLPMDYTPGKPLRLKKLGRRLGNLRGDLYVRLMVQ